MATKQIRWTRCPFKNELWPDGVDEMDQMADDLETWGYRWKGQDGSSCQPSN